MADRMPPVIIICLGRTKSWPATSVPRSASAAARVTKMPAAVEMISAGSCCTRPSPTVKIVYLARDSIAVMSFCSMPMAKPALMLMMVMIRPATASPRTNLLAPSIAP